VVSWELDWGIFTSNIKFSAIGINKSEKPDLYEVQIYWHLSPVNSISYTIRLLISRANSCSYLQILNFELSLSLEYLSMKINQILQVVVVGFILSVGYTSNLPVDAFVITSTNNNNSLITNSNSFESSNLSDFGSSNLSQFSGKTLQNSQQFTIDCNLIDQANNYARTPESSLISGLFFVVGLGIWSQRKKIINH